MNLDIDRYSLQDLYKLFNLKTPQQIHDEHAILNRKHNLEKQLTQLKSMSADRKYQIQFFLDTAVNKLLGAKLSTSHHARLSSSTHHTPHTNPTPPSSTSVADYLKHGNTLLSDVDRSKAIIVNHNTVEGRSASKLTQGRSAGSADVPPGYINPINVRTITQGVNLDTRFRDNYYSTSASDFVIHLPHAQRKVVSMRIATIELPMTFYAISRQRGNATMVIQNTDVLDFNSEAEPPTLPYPEQYTNLVSLQNPANPVPITLRGGGHMAWLVILPDGNYELDWLGKNKGANLVTAMNNAISLAVPGYVEPETGRFGAWVDPDTDTPSPATPPYHTIRLNPRQHIAFMVEHSSGRAVFATPDNSDDPLTPPTPPAPVPLNMGARITFAVDHAGNLNLEDNIQLRMGWELGFRVGTYICRRTEITPADGETPAVMSNVSFASEGVCMVAGPRYAFISIDDGQKSTGSSLIAAYSKSSLDKNIITRVNVSAVIDDVGVFKPSSDAGLSNQLNRTREYFGAVDIERLHIKLLDEYGRILELNNMDWSMTIVFETMYD